MIRQTLMIEQLDGNIKKSILEVDAKGTEELFLLFSPGRTNGPAISRTGRGSPTMINPLEPFGKPTADADLQRYKNLVVAEDVRQEDLTKIRDLVKKLPDGKEKDHLNQHIADLIKQKTYLETFQQSYGDEYAVVAMQGFGDLTMNLWNVAFVNDKISSRPEILHLFDEPFEL